MSYVPLNIEAPGASAAGLGAALRTASRFGDAPLATTGVSTLVGISPSGAVVRIPSDQPGVMFATVTSAALLNLSGYTSILIGKWNAGSIFSPARYAKVVSTPTHSAYFTDVAGNKWELDERSPDVRMVGAICDAITDDQAAIQRAVDYVRIKWGAGNVRGAGAVCGVGSAISIISSGIVLSGEKGNKFTIRRLANTGAIVAVGGQSTTIGKSGVRSVDIQDLTDIGSWATSPYGLTFTNCTNIVQEDYELYCESMLWAGVYSTRIGNGKIFYAGGEKSYSAGRNGWLVTKHTISSGHQSTEIWADGHVDIQCGKVESGGTVITSYCTTGLKVNCCDGFDTSGVHVQGSDDADITIENYASSGFDCTNITIGNPFCDLGNGHGIKVQGDTAITGFIVSNAIISKKGFNSTGVRYGLLITGIVKDASIHIARVDGTMADAVRIQNASSTGCLIIDYAINIGCKTSNTYDVVSIAQGTDWVVRLGAIYGSSKARSGVFFGATSLRCSASGGAIAACQYGVLYNSTSSGCVASGINLQNNSVAAADGHVAATSPKIRACAGIADYG